MRPLPRAPGSLALLGALLGLAACSTLVGADFEVELAAGGAGGAGGAGTGGAGASCEVACYDGPEGTEGVGTCKEGSQGCSEAVECVGQVLPAAEDCATAADESCDGEVACTGAARWARRFGADLADQALEIGVFPDGDVFVAGFVRGTVDLGGGPSEPSAEDPEGADAFVVRLDPGGEHVWSKRFGGPGGQSIRGGGVDPEDGALLVAGNYATGMDLGGGPLLATAGDANLFVAKLDAETGEHVWSQGFGAEGSETTGDFGVSASGIAVLAGGFDATLDLGGTILTSTGASDAFVAALSTEDGSVLWAKSFGDPDSPTAGHFAEAAAVSDAGAVVVAGRYHGALVTPAGTTLPGSADVRRAFVVGLGKDGEETFALPFDTADGDVRAAAFDGESPVVAGIFSGTLTLPGEADALSSEGDIDVFVAELDAAGGIAWAKSFGGPGNDVPADLAVDGAGQIAVAGRFQGTLSFGGDALTSAGEKTDVFVAKLGEAGSHVWSLAFGDAASQEATSVTVGALGEVFLSGITSGALLFAEGVEIPAPATASADAFAAKLSP